MAFVAAFGLLAFDDDIARLRIVLIEDNDVGALFSHRGAKVNAFLDVDSVLGIAVVVDEFAEVELADDLFELGGPVLAGNVALQIWFAPLLYDFQSVDFALCEQVKRVPSSKWPFVIRSFVLRHSLDAVLCFGRGSAFRIGLDQLLVEPDCFLGPVELLK